GAVSVTVPPQIVAEALGTVNPAGRVSVNDTPVSASTLLAGLVIVKVRLVVAPSAIEFGLNALAIDGGVITFIDAFEVLLGPPSFELASTLLFFPPAVTA